MVAIECLEHVPDCVARRRACPRVPLVPKCTRLVPATNRNLAITGNTTSPFAGISFKPSDGLEPSTPSLPWRFWGGTRVHGRASKIAFDLQISALQRVIRVLAYPRVPDLMYPSGTRGVLSVLKTYNGGWIATDRCQRSSVSCLKEKTVQAGRGNQAAQRRQQRSISSRQLRPRGLSAKDHQLVAEDQDLDLLRATRPPQQPHQGEQVPDNEIHKRPAIGHG